MMDEEDEGMKDEGGGGRNEERGWGNGSAERSRYLTS